ncbi:MAG: hypothetical protein AB7O50_08960 [Pseudolabrys sp.]
MPLLPAFFVWLAIVVAESLHGALRRIVWGDDIAVRQAGVAIGAVIVIGITLMTVRQLNLRHRRDALAVGALWVTLTVAFDIVFGRITGASWPRIWSDFDLMHGGLLPLGLFVMLFAPALAQVLRRG